MTIEEGKKVIDELESQGASKEEIAGAFYLLFRDDKIDSEQLEALVNLLGYELNDEFKNMSPEEQKENGYELTNDPKDNVPTPPREGEDDNKPSSQPSQPEEEDEDEEEKASKLFEGKTSESNNQKPTSPSKEEDDANKDEDEEEKAMKLFGR